MKCIRHENKDTCIYVCTCVCMCISPPPHPQLPEEMGKVGKVRERKEAGLKKRQHLTGQGHHCPLHPSHHSFKANERT